MLIKLGLIPRRYVVYSIYALDTGTKIENEFQTFGRVINEN